MKQTIQKIAIDTSPSGSRRLRRISLNANQPCHLINLHQEKNHETDHSEDRY